MVNILFIRIFNVSELMNCCQEYIIKVLVRQCVEVNYMSQLAVVYTQKVC